MSLTIYLHFNGNCREAFEFYRSIFGGEFDLMETFRNGPPDMGMSDEELDQVMHVSYPIGTSALMGLRCAFAVCTAASARQQFLHLVSTREQRSGR